MKEQDMFSYCPKCGAQNQKKHAPFICEKCSYRHYFSPKPGTKAIIITPSKKVVLTRRNIEPFLGTLDLVGGFLEPGETFEEGIIRETKEELGVELAIGSIEYLGSFATLYIYQKIVYEVIVPLFVIHTTNEIPTDCFDPKEIQEVLLLSPEEIHMEDIGPEDYKKLLHDYLQKNLLRLP